MNFPQSLTVFILPDMCKGDFMIYIKPAKKECTREPSLAFVLGGVGLTMIKTAINIQITTCITILFVTIIFIKHLLYTQEALISIG